jgi:hypothetical protein
MTWFGLGFQTITALPSDCFQTMPNIERIGLGQNLIGELPAGIFDGLAKLKSVWLYSNFISQLDPDLFADNEALEEVNLRSNTLESVPDGLFANKEFLWQVWLTAQRQNTQSDGGGSRLISEWGDGIVENTPSLTDFSVRRASDRCASLWFSPLTLLPLARSCAQGGTCEDVLGPGYDEELCSSICTPDCSGYCIDSDMKKTVGDGICNDGVFSPQNFECGEFLLDGGDCEGDLKDYCSKLDCSGICMQDSTHCFGSCDLVFLVVTGDGTCDDGSYRAEVGGYGPNLNCAEHNWDGGDCDGGGGGEGGEGGGGGTRRVLRDLRVPRAGTAGR